MAKKYKNVRELRETLKKATRTASRKAVLSASLRVVSHIVSVLIPAAQPRPVDRGIYRAGFRARRIQDGALIQNTAPHALFVEKGVRGKNVKVGKAMIDALAGWVKRKGLVSKREDARGVAWAIAQSMRRKGIWAPRGLRILEKGLAKLPRFLEQEFALELRRAFL